MKPRVLLIIAASFLCQPSLADSSVNQLLIDAIRCKGRPEGAVHNLIKSGENFKHGYAAYGFGEETSYRAIVILESPLKVGSATSYAVISELENSNYNFAAYTYARFKGDYREAVSNLKLIKNTNKESSMGEFVSNPKFCPQTILLTPMENGEFLLGCGWPNGC